MSSLNVMLRYCLVFILFVIGCVLCRLGYANESPHPGDQYKIIRPVYLMAVYNSLNDRRLSRETARAYIHSTRFYDKSEVAFQLEVPVGTIMTILGPAPKVWYLPFLANRYFVQLDPGLSRGLDVELALNRGIEGSMDGLNPNIFRRLQDQELTQEINSDASPPESR